MHDLRDDAQMRVLERNTHEEREAWMPQSSHDRRLLAEFLNNLWRHLARVDFLHSDRQSTPQRLEHFALTALAEQLAELELVVLDAELGRGLLEMLNLLHGVDLAVLIREVDRAGVLVAFLEVARVRERHREQHEE